MRALTILLCFFLFAGTAVQAQNNKVAASAVSNNNNPEAQVRKMIQTMTNAHGLNNEQQIAVKKAAMTIVDRAQSTSNLDKAKRELLHKEFDRQAQVFLSAQQFEHYKNAKISSTGPILDAIIDAAKK